MTLNRLRASACAALLSIGGLAGGAQAQNAADSTLASAVAGPWRPAEDMVRDIWRHPQETLEFFQIDPSGAIAEIMPMGGYYARILLPWVAANDGTYVAVIGSTSAQPPNVEEGMAAIHMIAEQADVGPVIHEGELNAENDGIAPDNSLDAVLTFRNVHNWMMRGYAEKAFADFYAALKPGGILGLEEHRLPEDAEIGNTGTTGYVRTSHVIALAEAAGFVLEAQSEINANPADDADHPRGVWTLKPAGASPQPGTPEAEGFDRAAYDAIGESDRMTLRFRKPLQ